MRKTAVVFAPDVIRGNVMSRKLQHEGIEVVLYDRASQAAEAVAATPPSVFIFDTSGCIPEELRLLSRFCTSDLAPTTRAVILGEEGGVGLAWARDREGFILLPASLDPELLFSTIKQIFSQAAPAVPAAPVAPAETDDLEHDLKEFLRLG